MLQTVDGAVIEPVAAFVEKAITDAQVVIPQRFQSRKLLQAGFIANDDTKDI